MELTNEFLALTLYPSGFFLVFLALFIFYWVLSVIGGLDQNLGFDFDADVEINNTGFLSGLLLSWGLSRVPLSIGLTFASFFGFIISGILQTYGLGMFFEFNSEFNPYQPFYLVASTAVVIFSLFSALWIAGRAVQPLASLFDESENTLDIDYIGMKATVRSSKISDTFGEIKLSQNGNEHILTVYTDDKDIKKNDEVVIVGYNEKTDRYLVKKELI